MTNKKDGKIICVANEKGGAGKTTTACQLAGALGRRGYDVLVADCDSQQTSTQWVAANGGENFPAQVWQGHQYKENVVKQLAQLVAKFDIIVVDCAPSVEQGSTWGALVVSDLVIIPTKLNPQDIAALPAAKRLVRRAWEQSERNFPVRVLPVAARMHMQDDRAAVAFLSKDQEFVTAKAILGDRKAYPRSMLIGGTVHGIAKAEDSVREVEALADEVLELIGLSSERERMAA
jgi:chromosome partitioning protein